LYFIPSILYNTQHLTEYFLQDIPYNTQHLAKYCIPGILQHPTKKYKTRCTTTPNTSQNIVYQTYHTTHHTSQNHISYCMQCIAALHTIISLVIFLVCCLERMYSYCSIAIHHHLFVIFWSYAFLLQCSSNTPSFACNIFDLFPRTYVFLLQCSTIPSFACNIFGLLLRAYVFLLHELQHSLVIILVYFVVAATLFPKRICSYCM